MSKSVILGTAGHIDHGKSALVKALTGIDPDRLKEEKERGITIDLGFANLLFNDGAEPLTVGIVDVPGHERLIKNMLAGAGGIDILLMVIAADEGIMPQSREHLAICNMLRIKSGIIALTKADLVESEWVELVADEVKDFVKGTFLENARIIPVSAKTGFNMENLRTHIRDAALKVTPKLVNSIFRMPIDRVFTLKGFGTVVTGTALSGTVSLDMPVEILPNRISSKVRGLQTHGASADKAYAGQRIGINLQGLDKDEIKRGDAVVSPGRLSVSKTLDASLEMLADSPILKDRSLVHFYTGTSETIARVILYDRQETGPLDRCYCQFRLEDEIVALSGDRYIIRRFSPLETIGGGTVLDPIPEKRRRSEGIADLDILENGSVADKIDMKIQKSSLIGIKADSLEGWLYGDTSDIKDAITSLARDKRVMLSQDTYFHASVVQPLIDSAKLMLQHFHRDNPLKPGMPKEDIKARLSKGRFVNEKVFDLVLQSEGISIDRDLVRLPGFKIAHVDTDVRDRIISLLDKGGFQPPFIPDIQKSLNMQEKELKDTLKIMTREGQIVRISEVFYVSKGRFDELLDKLKGFFSKKQEITVAEIRDMLNTSRKYALLLAEYLDSSKITLRIGDVRKLLLK